MVRLQLLCWNHPLAMNFTIPTIPNIWQEITKFQRYYFFPKIFLKNKYTNNINFVYIPPYLDQKETSSPYFTSSQLHLLQPQSLTRKKCSPKPKIGWSSLMQISCIKPAKRCQSMQIFQYQNNMNIYKTQMGNKKRSSTILQTAPYNIQSVF